MMNIKTARSFLFLSLMSASLATAGCTTESADDGEDLVSADEEVGTTEDALTGSRTVGSKLIVTTGLNLRSGAGTGYRILTTMPAGASVTVLRSAPSAGWYNVKYGSTSGWASGTYLRAPSSSPSPGRVSIAGPPVRAHVQSFANSACSTYGCPYTVGTYNGHQPTSDRAIDMMMAPYGTVAPVTRGTNIANYGVANGSTSFKVLYVIWRQRINTIDGRGWRFMADRGSITQNHYDHVHVSFDP